MSHCSTVSVAVGVSSTLRQVIGTRPYNAKYGQTLYRLIRTAQASTLLYHSPISSHVRMPLKHHSVVKRSAHPMSKRSLDRRRNWNDGPGLTSKSATAHIDSLSHISQRYLFSSECFPTWWHHCRVMPDCQRVSIGMFICVSPHDCDSHAGCLYSELTVVRQ